MHFEHLQRTTKQILEHIQEPSIIIFSDMHIRNQNDWSAQFFLQLCEKLGQSASHSPLSFVFLGDIFDFTFGRNSYFQKKFKFFAESVEHLAKVSKEILYLPGNHEFFIEEKKWPHLQFIHNDAWSGKLQNIKISLTHGDLVYCTPGYIKFRKILFSKPITTFASLLPPQVLDWYALHHATHSRKKSSNKILDTEALKQSFETKFQETDSKYIVFGHFHTHLHWTNSKQQTFINLPSWEEPNILILNAKTSLRIFFGRHGEILAN